MKLQLCCSAKFIPAMYRTRIAYMIKSSLKKSLDVFNREFKNDFHYVFSVDFQEHEIKKENLKIDDEYQVQSNIYYPSDKFYIYISSIDNDKMMLLKYALTHIDNFDFSNNDEFLTNNEKCYIKIISVREVPEKPIEEKKVYIVRTLSPLFLDVNKKAIDYRNADFEKILNETCEIEVHNKMKRSLYSSIKVNNIDLKSIRIYDTIKDFRDRAKKPIILFDCSQGKFSLEIDKRDLMYFLSNGIGHKNNYGFGMIEVA